MSIQAWSSVHAAGWLGFPCHRVCIQPGLGKVLISDGGVSIQIVDRAEGLVFACVDLRAAEQVVAAVHFLVRVDGSSGTNS